MNVNRDIPGGVEMGCGLDGQLAILGRGKRFSLLYNIEIGSGAHTASYTMGAGVLSPEIRAAGA
jgi:hypothetical protein